MNRFNQPKSLFARLTDVRQLLPLAVAAGIVMAMPVQAVDTQQPQAAKPVVTPEQSKQTQEIQDLDAEFMELNKRFDLIHRDTLQAHPELQKREQALQDLIMQKMKGTGHNVQNELAELKKIKEKLLSGETPEGERHTLLNDYQRKAAALHNAKTQVMQNPDVQVAQKKLKYDVVAAMKEKDPQIEKLIQQIQQIQQQLVQLKEQKAQKARKEAQQAQQKLQEAQQKLQQAQQQEQQIRQKLQQVQQQEQETLQKLQQAQ